MLTTSDAHPIYPNADIIAADLRSAMHVAHVTALRKVRQAPPAPELRRQQLARYELSRLRREIERIIILLDGRR